MNIIPLEYQEHYSEVPKKVNVKYYFVTCPKILMFWSPELLATEDGRGSWLAPEPTVSPA